jgi:hypothetical protein
MANHELVPLAKDEDRLVLDSDTERFAKRIDNFKKEARIRWAQGRSEIFDSALAKLAKKHYRIDNPGRLDETDLKILEELLIDRAKKFRKRFYIFFSLAHLAVILSGVFGHPINFLLLLVSFFLQAITTMDSPNLDLLRFRESKELIRQLKTDESTASD